MRHAIAHCELAGLEGPLSARPAGSALRLIYLGDDADRVALEVIAIELESGGPARHQRDAASRKVPSAIRGGEDVAQVRHQTREPFRTKSGELLTDEIIEKLSREAEAGNDLTRAEWCPSCGPHLRRHRLPA